MKKNRTKITEKLVKGKIKTKLYSKGLSGSRTFWVSEKERERENTYCQDDLELDEGTSRTGKRYHHHKFFSMAFFLLSSVISLTAPCSFQNTKTFCKSFVVFFEFPHVFCIWTSLLKSMSFFLFDIAYLQKSKARLFIYSSLSRSSICVAILP